MNFFEQQDIARRNTKRLIFLLVLAVISLIAMTVLFVALIFAFSQGDSGYSDTGQTVGFGTTLLNSFHWETVVWVGLIVCTVVSFGSFYKVLQLRSGGRAVAEAMGGRLLNVHTQDADEKKILNVVEEIAIASGTPVPPVYIIEDEAINAFAAGHNSQNAVIGITRGCIHLLNRDELQGVVAHEFSHIFHGDMRINIRLVALLHGILLLGLIGGFLVRSTHHRSMIRSSRDKSPAALLALGVGLMIIGYAGTFFGNIIKAAVSRQREFLADASAVQFTRNPEGIAGALKKIGGHVHGSHLEGDNVAEFSHMYFSEGIRSGFTSLMATHPPLADRIKRIEPRWNGKFPDVEVSLASALQKGAQQVPVDGAVSGFHSGSSAAYEPPGNVAALNESIDAIGQPTASHLAYAHQKLSEIGEQLKIAAHDPFHARSLIFGLFLDINPALRERQWQLLVNEFSPGELADIKVIAEQASRLDASLRLPLTELALPALKELTTNQCAVFKRGMEILIHADKKISLMEWALQRIVHYHLEPRGTSLRHHELRDQRSECQLLFSVLAYAGAKTEADAQAAFISAVTPLRFSALQILPKSACKMALLDSALTKLNTIKPLQKPQLLKAMMGCIAHDGKITATEAELFRAIADGLDCPIPPLIVTGG
jgi:Zn-dependent protease with chaperone function